jgi:hypothetical protein
MTFIKSSSIRPRAVEWAKFIGSDPFDPLLNTELDHSIVTVLGPLTLFVDRFGPGVVPDDLRVSVPGLTDGRVPDAAEHFHGTKTGSHHAAVGRTMPRIFKPKGRRGPASNPKRHAGTVWPRHDRWHTQFKSSVVVVAEVEHIEQIADGRHVGRHVGIVGMLLALSKSPMLVIDTGGMLPAPLGVPCGVQAGLMLTAFT